jgi:hypothetical protein
MATRAWDDIPDPDNPHERAAYLAGACAALRAVRAVPTDRSKPETIACVLNQIEDLAGGRPARLAETKGGG